MAYGIIYCITNTVNGKQYVGQTVGTLVRRWRFHVRYAVDGSACALHCAIRKYGVKAFKVEQVDLAESLKELNEKEAYYILQLETLAPNGYNLTTGGDSFKRSEETCRKMSESQLGRTVSEKVRQGMFNRFVSKETRSKMSKAHLGHRKVSCKNGHSFDEANTYINPNTGKRHCLTCCYLQHGWKLPQKLVQYVN